MNTQAIAEAARRVIDATDYKARLRALVELAPHLDLSRFGLVRRPSAAAVAAGAAGVFVAGAAVGAVAALLLAPTSGTELIAKIRAEVNRLAEGMKEAMARAEPAAPPPPSIAEAERFHPVSA